MASAGGGVFTYANDPAWSYRFRFTSTQGYAAVTEPPTADPPIEPAIGAEVARTATMTPRTIEGAVTGGAGGTVRLVSGPLSSPTLVAGPAAIEADATYTIPGPIPAGAYTLVAELTGTGRGTLPVTVALTDGNLTGLNIALAARTVTIGFTKTPAGATVTITPATGGAITGTGTSFDVTEDRFPISYVVSSPGFISSAPVSRAITTVNQAADVRWNATALTMTAAPVTLSARTISGTVTGASADGRIGAGGRPAAAAGRHDDRPGGHRRHRCLHAQWAVPPGHVQRGRRGARPRPSRRRRDHR